MTGIIDLSDPKYDDDELTNHNAFLGVFSEEWIEELVALVAEQFRKEKGALKTPEGTTSPLPVCVALLLQKPVGFVRNSTALIARQE